MLRLVYVVIEPSLSWDSGIRKVVIFRFDSLMYGVYLSIFIDRIRRVDQRKFLFFIGLIAMLTSMIAYFRLDPDHSFFLKTFQFSITSIGFMLVIPYMLDFRLAERSCVGSFFRKTALWSYSMYLSNFLIYNVIQQLIFSKYFTENIMFGAVFCIMLLIFSCYLVSSFIYKIYEFPLMNLREPVVVWLKKSLYRVGFHRQFTTP
jgi:peptidoglycan/LPS O-acetylase OafA/YrhL